MAHSAPTILLFLKVPRPGLVKTRLARTVGDEEACRIYRLLVRQTLSQIPPSWPLRIHFAPADAEAEMQDWLGRDGNYYLPQPEGDLGHRLHSACTQAFAEQETSGVILLGGDCPGLTTAHLEECANGLANGQSVLGPAEDGGYWLLGLPSPRPELFTEIPWSTEQVLPITLERLSQNGATPLLLETLFDVDDEETWQRCGLASL